MKRILFLFVIIFISVTSCITEYEKDFDIISLYGGEEEQVRFTLFSAVSHGVPCYVTWVNTKLGCKKVYISIRDCYIKEVSDLEQPFIRVSLRRYQSITKYDLREYEETFTYYEKVFWFTFYVPKGTIIKKIELE